MEVIDVRVNKSEWLLWYLAGSGGTLECNASLQSALSPSPFIHSAASAAGRLNRKCFGLLRLFSNLNMCYNSNTNTKVNKYV